MCNRVRPAKKMTAKKYSLSCYRATRESIVVDAAAALLQYAHEMSCSRICSCARARAYMYG